MQTLSSIAKEIAQAIVKYGPNTEAVHYLVTEGDISIKDSNGYEHKFSSDFSKEVLYILSEDEEVYDVINKVVEEGIKEIVGTI